MNNPELRAEQAELAEREPERTEREILWTGAMTCRMPIPVNLLPPRFSRRQKSRHA